MTPMYQRNVPPPIISFNHGQFLTQMAYWIKPENYLELGIHTGGTLKSISQHCRAATGVDVALSYVDQIMPSHVKLVESTTDDFIAGLDPSTQYDMVFIDAWHSHEQSLKDFIGIHPFVIEEGFIFLHDTSPCNDELLKPEFCYDCYKTPLYIKTHFIDDFELVTLPFNPGLTIVKKIKRNKQLYWKN